MKKSIISIAMLLVSFSMAAQDANMEDVKEKFFQAKVKEMVYRLDITDEQKPEFTKIYRAYTEAMREAFGEVIEVVPVHKGSKRGGSSSGGLTGVLTYTSNAPGGGNSTFIRGRHSFVAGTQPLYVLDGVPINMHEGGKYSKDGDMDPLTTLNPNDIESITILKDAAGTAIYGSRGANGVIVITTKSGASGTSNSVKGKNLSPEYKEALKEDVVKLEKEKAERQQKAQAIRYQYIDEFAKVLEAKQLSNFFKVEQQIQQKLKKRQQQRARVK